MLSKRWKEPEEALVGETDVGERRARGLWEGEVPSLPALELTFCLPITISLPAASFFSFPLSLCLPFLVDSSLSGPILFLCLHFSFFLLPNSTISLEI